MRGLSESTKKLIEYARRLLEADHPQTLRQLHYAIFSRQKIEYANDKASYARLSRATTVARRTYREWELMFPANMCPRVIRVRSLSRGWWMRRGKRKPSMSGTMRRATSRR
jgi:hypothetical protein